MLTMHLSIPYNPVFFSYAMVTPTSANLYVDRSKLLPDAISHLEPVVTIKPYDFVFDDASSMSRSIQSGGVGARGEANSNVKKFLISNKASWALSQALGGDDKVEEVRSPVGDAKAMKNETELVGMQNCHVRDGAALSEYFAWLEDQLLSKKNCLNEVQAADKLEHLRAEKELYAGLSFPCISSTGANAAVIHYQPEPNNCSVIDPEQVYLCDSGAQYLDGTTDTTRTIHFTNPTEMERRAYTLVLKGNIALERARFPKGVSGFALDTLARQFLWQENLDYRHGTGHGVGSYLVRSSPSPENSESGCLTLCRMSTRALSVLAHVYNILKFPFRSVMSSLTNLDTTRTANLVSALKVSHSSFRQEALHQSSLPCLLHLQCQSCHASALNSDSS